MGLSVSPHTGRRPQVREGARDDQQKLLYKIRDDLKAWYSSQTVKKSNKFLPTLLHQQFSNKIASF